MCLSLLVYTLTQRKLRQKLKEHKATIPSQTGREIENPSLKWIYQIFEGVFILYRTCDGKTSQVTLNLTPIRKKILHLLGSNYQQLYEDVA